MSVDKKLKSIDMRLIDDLFEMGKGYVLDFSDSTFFEFFNEELGVNINNSRYEAEGTSKAKRLRYYLRNARVEDVLKALLALWEYREAIRRRSGEKEKLPNHKVEFFNLIRKLGGKAPEEIKTKAEQLKQIKLNSEMANDLLKKLLELSALNPHLRGFAFEKFLKLLFDANGMDGRASFRLIGEQIDGSFKLVGETYLLEAKWQNDRVGASDLRSFNAKVEDKASWTRGLFVSYSGFSEEGLVAYGKGKSLVCVDGFDLSEMLLNRLSLKDVLLRKVRRAAETGQPFVSIRDLL